MSSHQRTIRLPQAEKEGMLNDFFVDLKEVHDAIEIMERQHQKKKALGDHVDLPEPSCPLNHKGLGTVSYVSAPET
jgi:hypothetical protein